MKKNLLATAIVMGLAVTWASPAIAQVFGKGNADAFRPPGKMRPFRNKNRSRKHRSR